MIEARPTAPAGCQMPGCRAGPRAGEDWFVIPKSVPPQGVEQRPTSEGGASGALPLSASRPDVPDSRVPPQTGTPASLWEDLYLRAAPAQQQLYLQMSQQQG